MNSSMNNSFQTEQQLSGEEIGIIRKEKRMGYVLAILILLFGLLLNLGIIFNPEVEHRDPLVIIDPLIILLSFFVYWRVNRKLNKDLRAGIKTVTTETVQKKEAIKSAEPGSGALFIPILGNLFPKLWGQEMKETTIFNLVIDSVSYNIEEETFARVEEGSAVKMHFAPNSKILLKVERA